MAKSFIAARSCDPAQPNGQPEFALTAGHARKIDLHSLSSQFVGGLGGTCCRYFPRLGTPRTDEPAASRWRGVQPDVPTARSPVGDDRPWWRKWRTGQRLKNRPL